MTTKITSANITQSGTSGISSVAWQAVQTTGFTAVAGMAYPCNTTSAAFTVTLPASPAAGNVITLTDYAGMFATNNLTIARNGNKINGATSDVYLNVNRASVQLVYVDSTQGWVAYSGWAATSLPTPIPIEYLVVAGGATGGGFMGGGGGGGGVKTGSMSLAQGVTFNATIGGGSAASSSGDGNPSSFSTISTTGGGQGGGGGGTTVLLLAKTGGSGGGGGSSVTSGNSLNGASGISGQGNAGGNSPGQSGNYPSAGGGGAGGTGGTPASTTSNGGAGGVGIEWPTGSGVYYGGGGGGACATPSSAGAGGNGVGGNGAVHSASTGQITTAGSNGSVNTGGGGGGGGTVADAFGGYLTGGSGVVIIRYADSYPAATSTTGLAPGYPVVSGGYRTYKWNGNGSITF